MIFWNRLKIWTDLHHWACLLPTRRKAKISTFITILHNTEKSFQVNHVLKVFKARGLLPTWQQLSSVPTQTSLVTFCNTVHIYIDEKPLRQSETVPSTCLKKVLKVREFVLKFDTGQLSSELRLLSESLLACSSVAFLSLVDPFPSKGN